MKVTKILLKDYLNFEDSFILDLTYPEGHTKEGEPLDKVCFIGQSGTGKTSLLNLIKYLSFEKAEEVNMAGIDKEKIKENVKISYKIADEEFYKNGLFQYFKEGNPKYQAAPYIEHIYSLLDKANAWLINFPFNVIEETDVENNINNAVSEPLFEPPINSANTAESQTLDLTDRIRNAKNKKVWDFSKKKQEIKNPEKTTDITIQELWQIIDDEILIFSNTYDEADKKFKKQLREDKNDKDRNKFIEEFFSIVDEDPFKKLANSCLNDILKKFNLEVDKEMNFKKVKNLKSIQLKQLGTDTIIPHSFHSTGTNQIMKTAIPLYFLNAINTIILFDQPESSLFPDMQLLIIDKYTNLTKNCQFFYATHSPIIASSFDPWEIFELVFHPESHKVTLRKNYKGKRELKNYHTFPKLLSFGDIYLDVFNMPEDGNSKYRKPEIDRLISLKSELIKLKKEKANKEILLKKLEEIEQLANTLGYNLQKILLKD